VISLLFDLIMRFRSRQRDAHSIFTEVTTDLLYFSAMSFSGVAQPILSKFCHMI